MNEHDHFLALLVVRDELTLDEYAELEAHLDICTHCREAGEMCTDNNHWLRTLEPPRPPRDLRRTILDAADRSFELIALTAPYIFALFIVPISLVAAAVVLIYGVVAWLALFAGVGLFGFLVAHRLPPVEGSEFRASRERPVRIHWKMLCAFALDVAGVTAGAALLSLTIALVTLIQQGQLSVGG